MFSYMVMEDIAWLDFSRIHGEELAISAHTTQSDFMVGTKRKRDSSENYGRDVTEEMNPVS